MISTPTLQESTMELPQPASGRIFFVSAAIAAACVALVIAEQQGFRIFDDSLRGDNAATTAIPSPMEFLALVGATSVGVVAGIVCALTSIRYLIYRLRHSPGPALADGAAAVEDECAMHNISCRQ